MDIIGAIFSNLKMRLEGTGLFSVVYGLTIQGKEDGDFTTYDSAGQSKLVNNFDNEKGSAFFLKRGAATISPFTGRSPVACAKLYTLSLPLRSVGVLQKELVKCDTAAAGFQIAQGMLATLFGIDNLLKAELKATKVELVPTGFDDTLTGLTVGNEYGIGVTDINILITTNIECLKPLC